MCTFIPSNPVRYISFPPLLTGLHSFTPQKSRHHVPSSLPIPSANVPANTFSPALPTWPQHHLSSSKAQGLFLTRKTEEDAQQPRTTTILPPSISSQGAGEIVLQPGNIPWCNNLPPSSGCLPDVQCGSHQWISWEHVSGLLECAASSPWTEGHFVAFRWLPSQITSKIRRVLRKLRSG